jgi:hypothetical protein
MKTPAPVQIDKMDAATYFGLFSEILKDNPPALTDYPMVHRLERLGFKVGTSFDLTNAPSGVRQAFERGLADGHAEVLSEGNKAAGVGQKGWVYTTRSGAYGVDYLYRAAIAQCCLAENLRQDAVYPSLANDSDGAPLDGSKKYVLRFEKGKLPPVNGFWSITAYDKDGYFIPNALRRQALGDRDNLVPNADGSIELYIQAEKPAAGKEPNWLPVATGPFNLLMQLYWGREEIMTGQRVPPPVTQAK